MKVSAVRIAEKLERGCPERAILEHLTSTWGVLVLLELSDGTDESRRFSELRRAIAGVSEKMLTQTLRVLERDGLVSRHARPVIPPHVDYALTPLGAQAAALVRALTEWTAVHAADVAEAQKTYDAAH
jgi:DNA-binding HxlR family transcriptional regulator